MLRYTDIFKHDLVVLSVECSYNLQYKKFIIIFYFKVYYYYSLPFKRLELQGFF